MIVLICGDRNWTNRKLIEDYIASLPVDTVIIHGGCRGADRIAGYAAEKRGLTVKDPFYADWLRYGDPAGPIRNRRMLIEGRPDKVVAFHNDISSSTGTKNLINQAKKMGIPYEVMEAEKW